MTLRELDRLFLRASKDLDARQRARIRELRGADRVLFEELVRRIVDALETNEGVITTRRGSASINQLIDLAFRVVERSELKTFQQNSANDLRAIVENAGAYFQAGTSKQLNMVTARANQAIFKRLGLDAKGKPIEGGKFDTFFKNTAIRDEVKQVVANGITSRAPMGKLLRQVEITVKGTSGTDGVFSKAFRNLVLDTYQQTDRAINKEYGTRLKLDTFIYAGGLIETSRDFCKKRNNKVFTEEEAAKWSKDPTLPRTTKERDAGLISGYDPLIDMGRWNCRHRTRYISRELAKQLRPDLPDKE